MLFSLEQLLVFDSIVLILFSLEYKELDNLEFKSLFSLEHKLDKLEDKELFSLSFTISISTFANIYSL